MATFTLADGKMIEGQVKEKSPILIKHNILGHGTKVNKMAKAGSYSPIRMFMMVCGKMAKCMVKESIHRMEWKFKGFGNMEI